MTCSRCKKRMAVLFISKVDGDSTSNEGLCLQCAKELGIPQVDSLMKQMGISEDELDEMNKMSEQLMEYTDGDSFELGGSETMPNFMQNFLGNIMNNNKKDENALDKPKKEEKKDKSKHKNKEEKPKRKFLDTYCTNLTAKAQDGELDNIIGRESEIYRIIQILSRRSKNNPCLIGEPGVGKTAIAEGIAQKIVEGDVPFRLQDKELYLLDLTSLVAGTQFRGQFESRVKGLIDEVKAAKNIILFIDEVHTLVGTGDSEGSMSAANILKPALSRGEVQVIGATTFNEYRKHIEKDSALERRFQPVKVEEPTISQTIDVLKGIRKYYEAHHKVKASDYIVNLAAVLSERYITDRYLPDKAIDLLDEACACCSIRSVELTEYDKLNKKLKVLYDEQEELNAETEEVDFEAIARNKGDIIMVKEELKELEPKVVDIQVEVSDVARVIELWTGIPAEKIEENEYKKINELDGRIKEKIVGQDEAVEVIANAIKRSRVALSDKKRPASFIFVGPTGVGKTEVVKVLANELFDSVDPLIRLDMTEYMEKHAVSKLIGSPPGYVGYDEAGQLTEKVRRKPYSVILFDEIEKAHPDIMNILLQILDEGRVTDAQGRVVNFENTVIAMTSNAGSSDKSGIVGFNKTSNEIAKEKATKALSDFLRPEFLGRVDEIVVFNTLSHENLKVITGLMLNELVKPLEDKGIEFTYTDEVLDKIVSLADGGKYAARDLRKIIRKHVEDLIANVIIANFNNVPSAVNLLVENDELSIKY